MSNAILDHRESWSTEFEATWLAHWQATGKTDFKVYPRPHNQDVEPSPGIHLGGARLLLVSSAGGYDPATQPAFDAPHPLGDYTIRELPIDQPIESLAFAHTHYDHAARQQDPGVLLPHDLLRERVRQGVIGELAPTWVSFMGYQPDLRRVVDETCSQVVAVALREQAQAALLVPS